jgi:hypothetical protein
MPIVKIVILNWNGAEHLRRFLPSVVAAAPAGRKSLKLKMVNQVPEDS